MAYKSFEEKYFGKETLIGDFMRETGKVGYGTVAGIFRFPTTVRKSLNKQTRIQREEYKGNFGKILGTATGYVAGACADIWAIKMMLNEASRDNYTPAIALGVTNAASFFYEFYRASKIEKKLAKYEPDGDFGGPTEP
jgi:hypothetical protein